MSGTVWGVGVMLSGIIDTCAEEEFISDEIARIKRQFRPLSSVKTKWFIHRILPKDTVLVEWDNRARLDLEIDISQWFTTREKLMHLLWQELSMVRDELDPNFHYSQEYIKANYGPDCPRQRFFPLIRSSIASPPYRARKPAWRASKGRADSMVEVR